MCLCESTQIKIMELLKNFSPGPLDKYRTAASFDWKKFKAFLLTEDVIRFEVEISNEFKKYPTLQQNQDATFDCIRHNSVLKMHALNEIERTRKFTDTDKLKRIGHFYHMLFWLDPSAAIRFSINKLMFANVLRSLGGNNDQLYIADKITEGTYIGCFCLTEIGHGTNTKGMQTRVIFDPVTKDYILHTPDFESAKCWAGLLGQNATHAIVYAQLHTLDGPVGLHPFVVQIRCERTLEPIPGVIVGDMGEKIGLNGVDNGFLLFRNYRIPKSALLSKIADVTSDGYYKPNIREASKRFGISLGALSSGRVNITDLAVTYLTKGVTIALRYAAVRKQFGPDSAEEIPILEYQVQQHRLLPYLATTYALKIFSTFLMETQIQFNNDCLVDQNKDKLTELGIELHGISSASKPASSWIARDALQEFREACGGHGYLRSAGLGDLRNNNDASCTYEGENHVLIQQTSNWLLKYWPSILKRNRISSPLQSVDFLSDGLLILDKKFKAQSVDDILLPKCIIRIYKWLVVYLIKVSYNKLEKNSKLMDNFTAKNENQVFYARTLAIVFIQHFILQRFNLKIKETTDASIRDVLNKLFALYGLFSLEKHMVYLYQGGYFTGDLPATLIQDATLRLLGELKNEAIALVDVIAPPDFLIESFMGKSNGQVYKNLQTALYTHDNSFQRPTWYKDIFYNKESAKL